MIAGHGVDIIDVDRIKNAIMESARFTKKVFTDVEIEYCEGKKDKYQSYAGKFAAKEAFLKAIGTGWAKGIAFTDVEIVNDNEGKPNIVLHNTAKEYFESMGYKKILVSISHTDGVATGSVIIF